MSNPDEFSYFVDTKKELAEGMNDVEYNEFNWGRKISWTNLPTMGSNLIIVQKQPDEKTSEEIRSWYNSSNFTQVAIRDPEIEIDGLKFSQNFLVMRRDAKKDRAPFLPNYTIRHFSFDNRDLSIDSRKMTAGLSHMIGEQPEETIQIERFIGGTLHMMNGKIWILEDNLENIIAGAVYGSIEPNNYWNLELFGTSSDIKDRELLRALLQYTFESYQKTPLYHFTTDNSENVALLKQLDFQISGRMMMTS